MRRASMLAAVVCLLATVAAISAAPAIENDDQKTLYALGLAMSQRLASFDLTEDEVAMIQEGLADGILGREPRVALGTYGPKIDGYLTSRMTAAAERRETAGQAFREKAGKEAGATITDTGLVYFEERAGDGASPSKTDSVKVHYHGTFPEGKVFDSSREGEPVTFALDGVVPCFSEGILKMSVGGKSKLICPPELAYGQRGAPPAIPPGATLVFEIELLEILASADATEATP